MWAQEKKTEKRKKISEKSLDNLRRAWYHRATPPGGEGGSTYGANRRLAQYMLYLIVLVLQLCLIL